MKNGLGVIVVDGQGTMRASPRPAIKFQFSADDDPCPSTTMTMSVTRTRCYRCSPSLRRRVLLLTPEDPKIAVLLRVLSSGRRVSICKHHSAHWKDARTVSPHLDPGAFSLTSRLASADPHSFPHCVICAWTPHVSTHGFTQPYPPLSLLDPSIFQYLLYVYQTTVPNNVTAPCMGVAIRHRPPPLHAIHTP